jgi:hypothetical protein
MLDSSHGVAILVIAALLFLFLIHRGFRGLVISVGE